jgi:hypothetical protein
MTRHTGSPPLSSSQHRDRTRTLVSWVPRHIVTPQCRTPQCRTPNEIGKTTKNSPIDSPVKSRRVHRYWYSSPWNPVTVSLKSTSSDLNHVSFPGLISSRLYLTPSTTPIFDVRLNEIFCKTYTIHRKSTVKRTWYKRTSDTLDSNLFKTKKVK